MYLVSRCLTGVNCKYDGGNNRNERVLEFCRTHKVCTVCPEGESGLGCPRAPAEFEPGGTGRIVDRDGRDVTKEFIRGAEIALEKALNFKGEKPFLRQRTYLRRNLYGNAHGRRRLLHEDA